jgi:hypothetical protein
MVIQIDEAKPRWKTMYRISGVVAITLGTLFLISIINLWQTLSTDNWLIKLFKLNAGFSGITIDIMHELSLPDVVILILVAGMYLGLYVALSKSCKIWSAIALVQPFLAIVLFIATEQVGRSAVMGAGLVISAVMLRSSIFTKSNAFLGILASVFLLIGDFGTNSNSQSTIIAAIIAVGYILLVAWFFLVGQRLFRLS